MKLLKKMPRGLQIHQQDKEAKAYSPIKMLPQRQQNLLRHQLRLRLPN